MGFVIDFVEKIFYYTIDGPVTAARGFIEKQRAKRPYYYYHKEYRRVTPIEDCRLDDAVCMYEATAQYKRDKMVEEEMLKVLRDRLAKCAAEEGPSAYINCRDVISVYENFADAFDVKYGELGVTSTPLTCMMRQKHRVYYAGKRAQQNQLAPSVE